MNVTEFIEQAAAMEHKRWNDWQSYLHSLCIKNDDGSLTIPADRVARWEGQIATHYTDLSHEEQELDRDEVRKYLPLIHELVIHLQKETKVLRAIAKEDNY